MNTTILVIIAALVALGIGAVVVYLIMKARLATFAATTQNLETEKEQWLKELAERKEEAASAQTTVQQLMQEKSALQREVELSKERLAEKDLAIGKLEQDKESLNEVIDQQQKATFEAQGECNTARKELELLNKQFDEIQSLLAQKEEQRALLAGQLDSQKQANAEVSTARNTALRELDILKEQMRLNDEERAKALDQQLQLAKEQLQNATQEILKQREEALSKTNAEQLGNVVTPLKEQLEAMQRQVADNIKTSVENKTSLEEAIKNLMLRTQEIGNDANNLAKALRNETKTQGNWGEMILMQLLESSGLEEGKHYDTQTLLRDASGKAVLHDETGRKLIPDVVVHYPDGKDCVIDSKVSLSAFLDYCKTDDPKEKEQALARHLTSVRKHVKELCDKDYTSYIRPPRVAMNYTIMFIPNESAMQLALQHDRDLWNEAFEKGICITSQQNLLVLLRMIQIAWVQVQQAQNQEEIFAQARKLLDRVSDFVERFDKVGEQIQKANDNFNSAKDKLYNGQQSIVKAANDMQKLGAKTSAKKQLPEPLLWKPAQEDDPLLGNKFQ